MSTNLFGEPLISCSEKPITGFYRNGCCDTGPEDHGIHTVCVILTDEFLAFSKARGNDLSTPLPQYRFPGLKAGDQWCLCAERWMEAYHAGVAPLIVPEATHERTLDFIELGEILKYARREGVE